MSLWILRKPDGTLIVPLPATSANLKGDGVVEIKKGHEDYNKFLKVYQDEQGRKPK